MELTDFDYVLPKELIAQEPVSPRDSSRLMIVSDKIEHKHFYEILDYLNKDDVLVINETKVLQAKLTGKKKTGAAVELIISEVSGKNCKCHIQGTKPRPGNEMEFGKYKALILSQDTDLFTVQFDADVLTVMQDIGELPTPPYIKKKLEKNEQYQTVYSKKEGSVAAPTAGLHFTEELLKKIEAKGIKIVKVLLHVDFGTFLPVRNLKTHKMHAEYFEVTKEAADTINNRQGRLIVVGTTSVRTLESVSDETGKILPKIGKTDIFIYPGYKFKSRIDAMITNFHLPKSTLLMLVSAFAGTKRILSAYAEAVKEKYRFFSFGDAMLLFPEKRTKV